MKIIKTTLAFPLFFVLLLLFGCGGGGGGDNPASGLSGTSTEPQVAARGTNQYVQVWVQEDSTTYRVYVSFYSGVSWGTPVSIGSIAKVSGGISSPQIVADASGDVVVVWMQGPFFTESIYANHYDSGSGIWGGAELLEASADAAEDPQVAADGSGNFIAIWTQSDGAIYRLYASRFASATGNWTPSGAIDAGTGEVGVEPQIASDGNGHFMAVWNELDGGNDDLNACRYSGGWGAVTTVNPGLGEGASPQVASSAGGDEFMVVWKETNDIYANRFVGAAWAGAGQISGGAVSISPQVAGDGNSHFVAAWDEAGNNIWGRHFSAGWEAPEELNSSSGLGSVPQVASSGTDNFTVTWLESDDVYYNRYDATVSDWSGEDLVNDGLGGALTPQVAGDNSGGNGDFMIVWEQDDSIESRKFE
ncbi:MAG: hypothetical protein JXK94_04810 [Deltaproteobacteria bacterium]|nr:hypothetical protein [Deltaproteobacteria bacterium]